MRPPGAPEQLQKHRRRAGGGKCRPSGGGTPPCARESGTVEGVVERWAPGPPARPSSPGPAASFAFRRARWDPGAFPRPTPFDRVIEPPDRLLESAETVQCEGRKRHAAVARPRGTNEYAGSVRIDRSA